MVLAMRGMFVYGSSVLVAWQKIVSVDNSFFVHVDVYFITLSKHVYTYVLTIFICI